MVVAPEPEPEEPHFGGVLRSSLRGQIGVPGLVGPRAEVDARVQTTWQKCLPRLIDGSLWFFNLVAFISCAIMLLGQAGTLWSLGMSSPELVLLASSVIALWVLSALGMWGTRAKHRTALRMYAFMLLVLILAQSSIVWELANNLDSSFTDQFASVISTLCLVDDFLPADEEVQVKYYLEVLTFVPDGSGSWDGSGSAAGQMFDGELGLLEQLCKCTELEVPRHCISEWIHEQWFYAIAFLGGLFGLEGCCAMLAWTYVDRLDQIQAATLKRIRRVEASNKGVHWSSVSDRFRAGLGLGDDIQEKVRREAQLLTSTWYFEGTVLFASGVMFAVLALQSPTVPPDPRLSAVLSIGEIFVTLFLTVDVVIQIGVCMTAAQRKRIPKQPWVMIDITALVSSWVFLLYSRSRLFSICRVLRVLRPMRTLRMLSEINVVLQTIVEALPLFLQACFLIFFLQMVFALICMSLWSGGLNFECQAGAGISASSSALDSNSTSNATLLAAPKLGEAFKCPLAVDCTTGEDEWELTWCTAVEPPRFIRSEAYGFTGFDNFLQAMLTMFVQMTGDGGMQDIPFALERAGAVMGDFGWTLMMAAVLVLTLLALNLFLAVCCAVFDDVHEEVFKKNTRIIERDEGYKKGSFTPGQTGGAGMLSLIKEITAATQQAMSANEATSERAREKIKSTEEKYLEYMQGIRDTDWNRRSRHRHLGWYRNKAKDIVLNRIFSNSVNFMVLLNALVLMSAHHGMSASWEATLVILESLCLLFFWLEFLFKVFGFGFGTYLKSNTHRLDMLILFCTSAGFLASVLTFVAKVLPATFPGYDLVGRGLHSLTSIRLVRLMRALQMSRWIYSHKQMRDLLETVFKSWESVLLIGLFTIFSLIMFAVVSMHLLGGSLGPNASLEDYPRTNVETMTDAFSVSFKYLTGEGWSGVMYFYMKNSDLPKYATALYFVLQYIWMRCLLFSLFVAVLLVNFAVDEDEKMPRQKIKFDREESYKEAHGQKNLSGIVRALKNVNVADEVKEKKKTSLEILTEANIAHPYTPTEGEPRDPARCSFDRFDMNDPVRLSCARIESSHYFEDVIMWYVMASCFIIAFESPELMDEYGLYFDLFNAALLALFYTQMGIRMIVHGVVRTSGPTLPYVKNPLNRLDIFVIVVVTMTYILPSHRVLRLVRVMVPLLELLRNDSLRTLIQTFALSLPAVGAILALLSILFAVFGIVGVEYFGGRLYRCVYADSTYDRIPDVANRTECELRDDAVWENPPWDFDNIFSAGAALFYMCINSGWAEIMDSTLDITDVDQSPSLNSSEGFWVYFAFFHITFSLFLLNLFIGVLSSAFSSQSGSNLTTALQQRWIRIQAMLGSFQPSSTGIDRPEVGVRFWRYRQKMWDLAEDKRMEAVWTSAIVFNITLLAVDHYPASDFVLSLLEMSNLVCLLVFTAELVIKVGAYSLFGYLQEGWHQIDMLVVVGSWSTRILGVKSGVGVLRAFRTVRLVLLVKRLPTLMALMNTVVACVGPAADIAAMSLLVFYLYGIVGMKVFGDAPTDMRYYNEENNFTSFLSTLRLLFQQITGQDMKTIVYDLSSAGYGFVVPFAFLGSFFFLIVFICMNLFIVTVLDNFANLCSLDETGLTTEEMEMFAESWHKLTFGAIWDVDSKDTGIEITSEILESLKDDEEAMSKLFQDKHAREADVRLRRFAELKRRYPAAPYFEEQDAVFQGWLHRPNLLAKATQGLLQLNDMRYFWIDSKCHEQGSGVHLCLNWYADGTTERDLDNRHEAGSLKIERVKIIKVITALPAVKLIRQKTAHETALEQGATLPDGRVNKMAAALSGRAWLVSLANAQDSHPDNAMAASFQLDYYEGRLAEEDTPQPQPQTSGSKVDVQAREDKEARNMSLYGNPFGPVDTELDWPQSPTSPKALLHKRRSTREEHKRGAQEEELSPMQARFRACIAVGIEIPATRAGCYACQMDDYRAFWPFFSKILEKLHRVDLNKDTMEDQEVIEKNIEAGITPCVEAFRWQGAMPKQLIKRWDIPSAFNPELPKHTRLNIGDFGMRNVPMSLAVSRNLSGFNLVAGMTVEERTTLEDLVLDALGPFLKAAHWRGRYVSLTPGHPNEIDRTEHLELVGDGLMYPSAEKCPEMVAGGAHKPLAPRPRVLHQLR
eukprot:COSAG06_NODE_20_length_33882_cov_18.856969_18_plen_2148_part_00